MTADAGPGPNRRRLLRSVGASAVLLAFAGCMGGENDDSTESPAGTDPPADDDADTDAPTDSDDGTAADAATDTDADAATDTDGEATATGGTTPAGTAVEESTVRSDIDEFEIREHSGAVADGMYEMTVTVANTGDEATSLREYTYDITLYDADGADITAAGNLFYNTGEELGAGETRELRIQNRTASGASPADVAKYRIVLECGFGADGAYC